jgi:hypothetical protein
VPPSSTKQAIQLVPQCTTGDWTPVEPRNGERRSGTWGLCRHADGVFAEGMGKGSRIAYYILAPALIVGCICAPWIMGESILTAGGYFN